MYRWERDASSEKERRILVDPDHPYAYWGIVELVWNGDWFVVFPALGNSFFQTLAAAQRTVESAQGFDPSEVEHEG